MVATDLSLLGIVEQLKTDLGLADDDVAGALGVSTHDLQHLQASRARLSATVSEPLHRLVELRSRLQTTFLAEDVAGWMQRENHHLKGLSPALALRAGLLDRVEGALEVVDAGIFL